MFTRVIGALRSGTPGHLALACLLLVLGCSGPDNASSSPGSARSESLVEAHSESRGPADPLVVPAVERGGSRVLIVARPFRHQSELSETYIVRLEGAAGSPILRFSRGNRGVEGEVRSEEASLSRIGSTVLATPAREPGGAALGAFSLDGDVVVAEGDASRVRYSSPSPGTLQIEISFSDYSEKILVSEFGAVFERFVDGVLVEKGGLDPDGLRYALRRDDDPEGTDELEYHFSPGGEGMVIGVGGAEPYADFYVEGLSSLFPDGQLDLLNLAVAELAIGRVWRFLPALMREWKLAARR